MNIRRKAQQVGLFLRTIEVELKFMSNSKDAKAHRNWQKQHDLFVDDLIHMAGRSLDQALKDTFFRKRFMLNNQYKFYLSLNDSPVADFMIAQLDREKALLDMQEYQHILDQTQDAVKKEATKAIEEAIDDLTKDFNK